MVLHIHLISWYYLFLSQVQDVTMEIQDLIQWLENTDLRLSTNKTTWGMPDSASDRLNAHLVMLFFFLYIQRKMEKDISEEN